MSRDSKNGPEQSSIDVILKSLASRPNVQSTLILSRKDGTIIRATGFSQLGNSNGGLGGLIDRNPTGIITGTISSQSEGLQGSNSEDKTRESPTPEQEIATNIYDFVNISSRLATDISQKGRKSAANTQDMGTDTSLKSHNKAVVDDDDVQLLRMRTKKYEVIIFPDRNYLCCVIQNLERDGNRGEPR